MIDYMPNYTFYLRTEIGVKLDKERQFDHVPEVVEISLECKIPMFCNEQMKTEKNILNNKSDVTIGVNEQGLCVLIDMASSGGRNVT
jgi:hypothetical protein